MAAKQLRFNYKISITNDDDINLQSASVYRCEIPALNREVNQYVSNKQGVINTPQKEIPSEFTMEADLETVVDAASNLGLEGGNAGEVLAALYGVRDSDFDTVDVLIQFTERGSEEVVTWQILAEGCHITSISGTDVQADDDSEVARVSITLLPQRVRNLEKVLG